MENKVYPKNFHKLFMKQTKRRSPYKSKSKSVSSRSKTCKTFCKNVFLPERERVEIEFAKKNNLKYMTPNKTVKDMFLKSCDDIYCQKKCKGSKSKWLKSFSKKRKDNLIQQGATSGCRDLKKEYSEYKDKNI
jgi:hypothetical protein